jgi:hypothetical protein
MMLPLLHQIQQMGASNLTMEAPNRQRRASMTDSTSAVLSTAAASRTSRPSNSRTILPETRTMMTELTKPPRSLMRRSTRGHVTLIPIRIMATSLLISLLLSITNRPSKVRIILTPIPTRIMEIRLTRRLYNTIKANISTLIRTLLRTHHTQGEAGLSPPKALELVVSPHPKHRMSRRLSSNMAHNMVVSQTITDSIPQREDIKEETGTLAIPVDDLRSSSVGSVNCALARVIGLSSLVIPDCLSFSSQNPSFRICRLYDYLFLSSGSAYDTYGLPVLSHPCNASKMVAVLKRHRTPGSNIRYMTTYLSISFSSALTISP